MNLYVVCHFEESYLTIACSREEAISKIKEKQIKDCKEALDYVINNWQDFVDGKLFKTKEDFIKYETQCYEKDVEFIKECPFSAGCITEVDGYKIEVKE